MLVLCVFYAYAHKAIFFFYIRLHKSYAVFMRFLLPLNIQLR